MAKFSDLHTDEEFDLMYGYIVARAREDRKAALAAQEGQNGG
jgi:hypothetical protein